MRHIRYQSGGFATTAQTMIEFRHMSVLAAAPLSFVEQYYRDDVAERDSPESRWALGWLREVKGQRVLSVGCGPVLYDEIPYFGEVPRILVGVDYNPANVEFLKHAQHPSLVEARRFVHTKEVLVETILDDFRSERGDFVGQFDTIYAGAALGMLQAQELLAVLRILRTYLRPRGRLLDVDWTDCRLSVDRYTERHSYGWYSTEGPTIEQIGELMHIAGFHVVRSERYFVPDPESYGWGTIYGYLALVVSVR